MKKRNWKLKIVMYINFNGTEEQATEKLKEDAEYLENEYCMGSTKYIIQDKTIDAHGVWKKID